MKKILAAARCVFSEVGFMVGAYIIVLAMLAAVLVSAVREQEGVAYAQSGTVTVVSAPDITGDNAAHQLATSGTARWVLLICPSSNSAAVRIGNDGVGSSVGAACAAGGALFYPPLSPSERYDLSKIYYLAGTGDKIQPSWAR